MGRVREVGDGDVGDVGDTVCCLGGGVVYPIIV